MTETFLWQFSTFWQYLRKTYFPVFGLTTFTQFSLEIFPALLGQHLIYVAFVLCSLRPQLLLYSLVIFVTFEVLCCGRFHILKQISKFNLSADSTFFIFLILIVFLNILAFIYV